jgi:hypothetical protein
MLSHVNNVIGDHIELTPVIKPPSTLSASAPVKKRRYLYDPSGIMTSLTVNPINEFPWSNSYDLFNRTFHYKDFTSWDYKTPKDPSPITIDYHDTIPKKWNDNFTNYDVNPTQHTKRFKPSW